MFATPVPVTVPDPPPTVAQVPSCLKNCPVVPPVKFKVKVPPATIGCPPTAKAAMSLVKPTLVTVPDVRVPKVPSPSIT